ncbi:hypothetical protein BDD43_0097 [Mucilaginibacter gracilis]|uniref:Uncharacterized protein n=1 Tax=Mucilaginibacter gracilis TaxID=423350 RepID=A0A495IVX4_9SPHI|nr:hypothetical protein [Mucilaginibacter gracilis]RKR80009.1 hypothetical protein BDD43_0097 [Mucilaginibacter gracilis]
MPVEQKKHPDTPTLYTKARIKRLAKGKHWVTIYNGQHIVKGYAKKFSVDLLTALKELRMLGITISEQYEQSLIQTLNGLAEKRKQEKLRKEIEMQSSFESDDEFAFIMGYTSGGAAYGIKWEDWPVDNLSGEPGNENHIIS